MEEIKQDQIQRLRKLFESEQFDRDRNSKLLIGELALVRLKDNSDWVLTTEEVEDILREYEKNLSATVQGNNIVIFLEHFPIIDNP